MRAGPHLQLSKGRHCFACDVSRSLWSHCDLKCAQAHAILDEIVMGGAVFETSSLEALRAFNEMQRLEKQTDTLATGVTSIGAGKFRR